MPCSLFSSIFHRIPATAISSGIAVRCGVWARKYSISVGVLTERRTSSVWAWPSLGGWFLTRTATAVQS